MGAPSFFVWLWRQLKVVLYLLPFFDGTDRHDLGYFVSAVRRDLAWVRSMGHAPLASVASTLESMLPRADETIRWVDAVHLGELWTAYNAARLELLGALPREAWAAALEELSFQQRKVLPASRARWLALLERARAAVRDRDPSAPSLLQKLQNEVEFARQHSALRTVKFIRLANVAWLLIASLTALITFVLSRWREGTEQRPVVWLVLLFGLLGGSVSALQQNERVVSGSRAGLRVGEAQLRLRPLLGGMAAVVVYAVAQSGLMFRIGPADAEATTLVQLHVDPANVPLAYYVLAFVAGFSERFYLGLVDRLGERLVEGNGQARSEPSAIDRPGEAEGPESARG